MDLKKLERNLRVNLLGTGTRLMKKEFTGRGFTTVQKHCFRIPVSRNYPSRPYRPLLQKIENILQ